MAFDEKEGKYPPMSPKEMMDTLRSMREIIYDFQ
jgi:hypothetical protein